MPNASSTQGSSAAETTGTPISLDYGYVWRTGKRHAYYTLQKTGYSGLDYTRVGFWLLGHGEWDGIQELWINDQLAWAGDTTVINTWLGWNWFNTLDYPKKQDIVLHWHSGCDSEIGSGLTPQSEGPDQQCDKLWSVFPPAIQPLCFSRIAYFGLMRKQPVLYPTTGKFDDPSQWTDIAPVGLFRSTRCRLFDGNGQVTGYAFTRNPVWHWIDVTLRRELFPDYALTYQVGPDPLPDAVSARFDWDPIFASAQYCDERLAGGQPRFTGDYSFSAQTSLQAIKSQMLLCARGYERESQGKMAFICDRPRAAVFIVSREHMMPGSFEDTGEALRAAGNRFPAKFRDILVPAAAVIAGISNTTQGDPEITTVDPHPFIKGDRVAIGGTDTVYDSSWAVSSVPDIISPGTPSEVDPTTFTIARKGANYPSSVGAGGAVGLLYCRFKERTPEFWHKHNMLARGAMAINLPRLRNKIKQGLDFAISTWDQVSRIAQYERDRTLGVDQAPYTTPPRLKLRIPLFARDSAGRLACGIEAGDRITIDDKASWTYAGDYEVIDPLIKTPPACALAGSGAGFNRTPAQDSGEIEMSLQPYNENYMYDTSDPDSAGYAIVPGSFPGNDTAFTSVPLDNGGNFVFFTGSLPSGNVFQLPSTGYSAANVLSWASPAGANVAYHSAHTVRLCDADVNRLLTLIYDDDEGHTWGGDVNYAALTWRSPDTTTIDSNGMTWLALTLKGGEEILFGRGILADGATIALPAGWSTAQCFARAYIHDQPSNGHIMYFAGAHVDGGLGVHVDVSDSAGHTWHGNASVFVFAWKNNMGTVTTQTLGGGTWISFPLSDGSKFGMGSSPNMADGSTLSLPSDAGGGSTLEAMVGSSDGTYTAGSNHAQGIGTCYLDQSDVVHITFNDGSGDIWPGHADVIATYTVAAVAGSPIVRVTPGVGSIAQGESVGVAAAIDGLANQAVTWSVDGIPGGNDVVGTIDSSGNYIAPTAPGTHTISAISVADGVSTGETEISVTGASAVQLKVISDSVTAIGGVADVTLQQFAGNQITLPAPTGAMSYVLPIALTNASSSFYYTRGLKRIYGTDYSYGLVSGVPTLTILRTEIAPQTGDTHELYAS